MPNISKIISVKNSVLAPLSEKLNFGSVCFTDYYLFPDNYIYTVTNAKQAAAVFGESSKEAQLAELYFPGFDNATSRSNSLIFYKYVNKNTPAFLLGGKSISSIESLKAITDGAINFNINGTEYPLTAIDFSSASTYSDIALILSGKLNTGDNQYASINYNTFLNVFEVITVDTGTAATIGFCTDPTPSPAAEENSGNSDSNTNESGSEEAATPTTRTKRSASQTTENSSSRATGLSALLALNSDAQGAYTQQGINALTPKQNIDALIGQTSNFVSIFSTFDITEDETVEISNYINTINQDDPRILYLADTANSNVYDFNNPDSLGHKLLNNIGSVPVFSKECVAMLGGWVACNDLDNDQSFTVALKTQTGAPALNISDTQFDALISNYMTFYAKYSTKSNDFNLMYPGKTTGIYNYIDSFVNAIWLSERIKISFAQLMQIVKKISYTPAGYELITSRILTIIDLALSNGVIEPGITLTDEQITVLTPQIGSKGLEALNNNGYYIIVGDPKEVQDRITRNSPQIFIWYTYGGAIQQLVFNVTQIQ